MEVKSINLMLSRIVLVAITAIIAVLALAGINGYGVPPKATSSNIALPPWDPTQKQNPMCLGPFC